MSLGTHLSTVESALADVSKQDVVGRIWRKDHTVWRPDPTEITNRLGWLTVHEMMSEQAAALDAFVDDVRTAGYRHVVLLGMGGSSLGPEVLRQAHSAGSGQAAGYLELTVLDSTVPASVLAVAEAIDPARTLFLVSSKSGSTLEPNTFYAYFRGLVDGAVGEQQAGQSFVAVTDPGTSLEGLAGEDGFRKVFLNPPDIGGRYSVLSYFGLVPAALTGVDFRELLNRADSMREACGPSVPARDNPGAWLGVVMGTLARQGRDKLTIVASPSVGSFGPWAEQLIAESTGKEGRGIVPVAGEPLVSADAYGDDRLFVYLRLGSDDNSETDAAVEPIEAAGHPLVRLDMRDIYDLGAEFYRWEFATAVAGAVLGIHPFDQPNVQQAKDMTERVLGRYQESGQLPEWDAGPSLRDLLDRARPPEYLAIMAYVRQTPEVDRALDTLRLRVLERHGIATTAGYGPRYLHSTGQLHKGGPASGVFLQLTTDHDPDVAVPGKPYTFGTLADAQALGDLKALRASGRRAARAKVGRSGASDILRLAAQTI